MNIGSLALMESKTFRLGSSTRYRSRCHEEPASSNHQPRTGRIVLCDGEDLLERAQCALRLLQGDPDQRLLRTSIPRSSKFCTTFANASSEYRARPSRGCFP